MPPRPMVRIDQAPIPHDGGQMELFRRGRELVVMVNGRELMSDHVHGSEEALAELAADVSGDWRAARVLVGGLGLGFTLAAVLRRLGPDGRAVVAELVPAIVRWNRTIAGGASGHPLSDPRASIYAGDVADVIRHPPAPWDAILLDVDNGPQGLVQRRNNWLYSWEGLDSAWRALRPGGVLGVWSAFDDRSFTRRLSHAGFATEMVRVRARGQHKGGHRHTVWLGVRGETRPEGRGR